jgi:hypothetical protein
MFPLKEWLLMGACEGDWLLKLALTPKFFVQK